MYVCMYVWVCVCVCVSDFAETETKPRLGPYSHFIYFVANEWASQGRVFHYNRMESLTMAKHSNLSDPFANYEENEVLWL
jgi:hypothetical protein